MIQLKVYDSPEKLEQYWIDLYETEPIKLTLSIEDITNADATSTYSKTFKVPGTRKNAEFFKNAFEIDGTLFDVTVKKPAEILVDGAEFKQGQIRLQKIYRNEDLDRIDYELLFLGETRDFSSIIGDKSLCELGMNELIGGPTNTILQPADVQQSWLAYPESPSLTAGLHNGDIIYPLVDHGNSYDSAGIAEQTKIALTTSATGSKIFVNSGAGDPLNINRLKPMIRAKRIVDQIFQDAGYTYSSDFFESALFKQIYISAWGNEAEVIAGSQTSNANSNNVASGNNVTGIQYAGDRLYWPLNWIDPGTNLSNEVSGGTVYNVPAAGTYTIQASAYYEGSQENSDYSSTPIDGQLVLRNYTTSTDVAVGPVGFGTGTTLQVAYTGGLSPGHKIGVEVRPGTGTDNDYVTQVYFAVTAAPGLYNPVSGLDCQYKQIDFIKDILTAFRLVLAPDPNKPQNFIVEPWQTYINSGQLHDWSHKLVESKDFVSEPVFFSQSDVIDFKFQPGGDYTNIYHQQAYENVYGYLEFNSNNDLLKGKREIKLLGIAPTIMVQIEGADGTLDDNTVIPQIHTHSSEDVGLQHLPIKAKTRMLFYNGLKPFNDNPQDRWFLETTTGSIELNEYPLVSPYQTWPIQQQTLNLNWANDVQYWGQLAGYNANGTTLYSEYWSRYISSLYNKYSRRVTAYFVLNNVDLNYFSFDDTIFINGTYYRPEKILDLQVGDYTEVQVQLLTANDYRPTFIQDELLTGVIIEAFNETCGEGLGYIEVQTNGTPEFTWSLTGGLTGTALIGAPAGNAPYSFTIENVPPGTYSLTLTDSLGRDWVEEVTVPLSSATPIVASIVTTPTSDCFTCDGGIQVTPSGGTAPYTIQWLDGGTGTDTDIYIFTNNQTTGPDFYQALTIDPVDPATYPQYTDYWRQIRPFFRNEDPISPNYDPAVINGYNPPNPAIPYFDGNNAIHFGTGVEGTYDWNWTLELTNIQGVTINEGDLYIEELIQEFPGDPTLIIQHPLPALPIDGTPVQWVLPGTFTSDPNVVQEVLFRFEIKDTPGGASYTGKLVGYRGDLTLLGEGGSNRTDLCPNQTYSFVIQDSLGCFSQQYDVTIPCETEEYVYIARRHNTECTQLGLQDFIVQSANPINFADVFTIQELDGCYSIVSETTQQPQYVIDQFFVDCAACTGGAPEIYHSYVLESCIDQSILDPIILSSFYAVGTIMNLSLNPAIRYTVTQYNGLTSTLPNATRLGIYEHCDSPTQTPPTDPVDGGGTTSPSTGTGGEDTTVPPGEGGRVEGEAPSGGIE